MPTTDGFVEPAQRKIDIASGRPQLRSSSVGVSGERKRLGAGERGGWPAHVRPPVERVGQERCCLRVLPGRQCDQTGVVRGGGSDLLGVEAVGDRAPPGDSGCRLVVAPEPDQEVGPRREAADLLSEAGFDDVRVATQSPFNLVLEARRK